MNEDTQPRYTTARLRHEVNEAKAYARREALEEAASAIDENWRRAGAMNCTEICAIIRSLAKATA